MAGAHGIDIVAKHAGNIGNLIGIRDTASACSIPFVTVDAIYDEPLSVQFHLTIFQRNLSETNAVRHIFHQCAGGVQKFYFCGIQIRIVMIPQMNRSGERFCKREGCICAMVG